jgi:hypothetical protein
MTDETVTTPGNGRRVQVRKAVRSAFTPAKRQAFLDHLSSCANVTRSAAAAGVGISTVYDARRRDPVFAAQWAEAMDAGYATLEALLIERAALGATFTPGDTPVPGPETIDTWLALDLLRMRHLPKAGAKAPGAKPRRATERELAEALCARLDRLERPSRRSSPCSALPQDERKKKAGPRPSPGNAQ